MIFVKIPAFKCVPTEKPFFLAYGKIKRDFKKSEEVDTKSVSSRYSQKISNLYVRCVKLEPDKTTTTTTATTTTTHTHTH